MSTNDLVRFLAALAVAFAGCASPSTPPSPGSDAGPGGGIDGSTLDTSSTDANFSVDVMARDIQQPPPEPPPPTGEGLFGCPSIEAPEYTGARGAPSGWSQEVQDEVRSQGMIAWRTPDENGKSCADCHGVDGLDLAVFAFTDADLRRRGDDHVPDPLVESVVDLVHLHRADFGIDNPCTLESRVFQPGGEVLPGATETEREVAFMQVLRDLNLRIIEEETIDDAAEAEALYRELVDTDVRRVPIPLAFPRWSDDHTRGEEYRDINDWITDEGVTPSPDQRDAWFALQDAYIADPSADTLQEVVRAMEDMIEPLPLQERPDMTRMLHKLNDQRFIAALVAQHFFRAALRGEQSWLDYGITAFDLEYEVRHRPAGEHSRPGRANVFGNLVVGDRLPSTPCHPSESPDGNVSIDCLEHIPEGMREELEGVESIWDYEAFGSYSPTWGTMAWLWDSSMMENNRSNVMKYWKQDIRKLDYHLLFTWMWATSVPAKMQAVESVRAPYRPPTMQVTNHLVDGDWWRHYFVAQERDLDTDLPGQVERNAMVFRMTRNLHMSSMFLALELLEAGASVNLPDVLKSELEGALERILEYPLPSGEGERIQELHERLIDAIDAAPFTEVRTIFS